VVGIVEEGIETWWDVAAKRAREKYAGLVTWR
jgi:hypothetical protein